ncbi:MAG: hypothetical protein SFX72_11340 [Isosphaeraceae bacterium]|nr:hypothetical protein [Isosphaeraceae bacterium]
MKRDPFYRAILLGLDGPLDAEVFEACVSDLLRADIPTLVPVKGGTDAGMDGAIFDGDGPSYPLVCTTAANVIGNLERNLQSYLQAGGKRRKVVLATSRSLTALKKKNIEKKAEELGFELVHLYDREAIADRLYFSKKWCLELLQLTGDSPSLSDVPKSARPPLGPELIGRTDDTEWLKACDGDFVLVGQPGSGKTALLQDLARQGGGLFLVGEDLDRVSGEIREKRPPAIYIDDAHLDPDRLVALVRIRREIGAKFAIGTTVWPGGLDDVVERLGVPPSRVRQVEPLTRDEIVEVLRAVGLYGTTALVREIVDQARGLPGMAVTLASLCRGDGVAEVALGTALKRSIQVSLKPLLGELAIDVLSCFALGGSGGLPWEAVAGALDLQKSQVRRIVAGLEAGGVVSDAGGGFMAVYPETLRHALVRDMFFTGSIRIDPSPLMRSARNVGGVARTLVGAKAVGASIAKEDLWPWIDRSGLDEAWVGYASIGRDECVEVLRHRPEKLVVVGPAALHLAPEVVLPQLLDLAETDPREPYNTVSHPIRLIGDWVGAAEPGRREALARRETLLGITLEWLGRGRDVAMAVKALAIAFSPGFRSSELDPGEGRTLTMTFGSLLPAELERLGEMWTEAFSRLPRLERHGWKEVLGLLHAWVYPDSRMGDEKPVHRRCREVMKSVAARMLGDLAGAAAGRPGVLQALERYTVALGMELPAAIDPDFLVLFPDRYRGDEEWSTVFSRNADAALSLGRCWVLSEPLEIAPRLVDLIEEASVVNPADPTYPRQVCQAIAENSASLLPWITALEESRSPAYLLEPFLRRMADLGDPDWAGIAGSFLEREDRLQSVVEIVLSSDEPPGELLERVLGILDRRWSEVIWIWAIRGQIPAAVLGHLLEHHDDGVAGAAAVGEWMADPKGSIREGLTDAWRRAVLRCETQEHWVGELLEGDPELAEQWLHRRFECLAAMRIGHDRVIVAAASGLGTEARKRLLGTLRRGKRDGWIVSVLVGDDLEVYRHILVDPEWADEHLDPIREKVIRETGLDGPDLDPSWLEKARTAMAHGFPPERVAQEALGRQSGWRGRESDMWQGWIEAFQALGTTDDPLVRRLATEGARMASDRKERAIPRERKEAVYGYR